MVTWLINKKEPLHFPHTCSPDTRGGDNNNNGNNDNRNSDGDMGDLSKPGRNFLLAGHNNSSFKVPKLRA